MSLSIKAYSAITILRRIVVIILAILIFFLLSELIVSVNENANKYIETFNADQTVSVVTKTIKNNENFMKTERYLRIRPRCSCRKLLEIPIYDNSSVIFNNKIVSLKPNVLVDPNEVSYYLNNFKFTCSLYSAFSKGPNQNVLSYSFYYENPKTLESLLPIANAVKKIYKDWIIRVYYSGNGKLTNKDVCYYECNENIIDFCDVNEMPFFNPKTKRIETLNADLIHAMMWRWFPIGDEFVKFYVSRDIDSMIIQREKDSVDVWLKRNRLFHIMRDNKYHNTHMLGGMWGYANERNRTLGKYIYQDIYSKNIQSTYNLDKLNPKYADQGYLLLHVWSYAKLNSTIHDSYHCDYLNGEPFPTKRPENMLCYVACFWPCCDLALNQTDRVSECNPNCRPKEHQDWIYC